MAAGVTVSVRVGASTAVMEGRGVEGLELNFNTAVDKSVGCFSKADLCVCV